MPSDDESSRNSPSNDDDEASSSSGSSVECPPAVPKRNHLYENEDGLLSSERLMDALDSFTADMEEAIKDFRLEMMKED